MATLYYTHLGDYRGPTWVDALKEAKSALREGGEANQEKNLKMTADPGVHSVLHRCHQLQRSPLLRQGRPLRSQEGCCP